MGHGLARLIPRLSRHVWAGALALVCIACLLLGAPRADAATDAVPGRIAGATRIDTAVQVAQYQFPRGADDVYLTRSDVFADAVAAGSLTDGPILLAPACGPLPATLTNEINRLDPDRIIALGGPNAICSELVRTVTGRAFERCPMTAVSSLGAATTSAPVVTGTLVGSRNYVVTRGVVPAQVGAVDVDGGVVRAVTQLPTGQGAWASVADADGDVYIGTYAPAHLYRLDTTTMAVRRVASLPDAGTINALAMTDDGTVVAGTLPDGAVYEYDPATGAVRSFGQIVAGEYAVRSIATVGDTIYAGVGSHAHLVAIDRDTGRRRDMLPAALSDQSFVYTLAATDEWLVAGTEPDGRVAVLPVDDPADVRVLPPLGERTVDAIAIDGDDVYFTGRTTGAVYHYDAASRSVRRLAIPVPREETRSLFVRGRSLVGTAGSGAVWRLELLTGDVDVIDLVNAGLPGGPEPVQSLTAFAGGVAVGGHWGLQLHTGATSRRVRVPGEPKAMVDVGGNLFAALYPSGEVWRYDGTAERVATIGHEQARPRTMHYDRGSGRVLVASQADYGSRGGALTVVDPRSGAIDVHRGIVPDHAVHAVVGAGPVVYLGTELAGGGGVPPAPGSARLVAWDLATERARWDFVPVPGASAILDLVVIGNMLYGLTTEGAVFAVDPATRSVERIRQLATGRRLVFHDGALFAATSRGIYRIDPVTLSSRPVLEGAGYRALAPAGGCVMYATRGIELLTLR